MLSADLISNSIPALQLHDTVSRALQQMDDADVVHLPVVADGKYIGLADEADLLDVEDENLLLKELDIEWPKPAVNYLEHFLNAVKIASEFKLTVVPVVKEGDEYVGIITKQQLLSTLSDYTSAAEHGGIIVLEMEPRNFSLSEISRIIETNDAKILHLNTYTDKTTGQLLVSIKLNRNDLQDILASLERYEYNVKHYFGDNLSEDEMRDNYEHLMNYLSI
ncbi:MAG: CBS domain-containing protein [Sphingobacteriales bacterium]|nr:CBS domain-containing protein [Sphingobacteriales bacterium]MBI3718928.1 CBS domain-containing protein [Sphingobacteriales bacterium]